MTVSAEQNDSKTGKWPSRIGAALFLIGMALAVVFSIVVFWPDQESTAFDRGPTREEALRSLHCPLVITSKDEATISQVREKFNDGNSFTGDFARSILQDLPICPHFLAGVNA